MNQLFDPNAYETAISSHYLETKAERLSKPSKPKKPRTVLPQVESQNQPNQLPPCLNMEDAEKIKYYLSRQHEPACDLAIAAELQIATPIVRMHLQKLLQQHQVQEIQDLWCNRL